MWREKNKFQGKREASQCDFVVNTNKKSIAERRKQFMCFAIKILCKQIVNLLFQYPKKLSKQPMKSFGKRFETDLICNINT